MIENANGGESSREHNSAEARGEINMTTKNPRTSEAKTCCATYFRPGGRIKHIYYTADGRRRVSFSDNSCKPARTMNCTRQTRERCRWCAEPVCHQHRTKHDCRPPWPEPEPERAPETETTVGNRRSGDGWQLEKVRDAQPWTFSDIHPTSRSARWSLKVDGREVAIIDRTPQSYMSSADWFAEEPGGSVGRTAYAKSRAALVAKLINRARGVHFGNAAAAAMVEAMDELTSDDAV